MRKFGRWVILAMLMGMPFVEAKKNSLPPLPTWNDDDLEKLNKGELIPGQALLTEKGIPKKEKPEEKKEDPKDKLPEKTGEKLEIKPVPAKPEIDPIPLPDDRTEIPAKILARYFTQRPELGLNDPQQLLSMQERADISYALETHMEESPVPIYLYLFDNQQKVPEGYEPDQIYQKHFGDEQEAVVLVYYFVGQPERSRFYLGGGASEEVPEWRKRELLSNAALTAREKSEAFSQLEDFVGQLSMRLFWVEQMMAKAVLGRSTQQEEGDAEQQKAGKSLMPKVASFWNEIIAPKMAMILVGLIGGLGVIGGCFYYLSTRRHYFSELPVKKRLSAERGANCGGILHYKDPNRPPSEQKAQFEEIL